MNDRRRLAGTEREYVFKRDGGKCHWCGVELHRGEDDFGKNPLRFTIDHKKPYSKGGKTTIRNCVASCRRCNITRADGGGPEGRRRGGLAGGVARAAKLTPERRAEIARAAAVARWPKT